MSDHAKELRRNARKLDGVPCIGDVRAAMHAAAAYIEYLERRLHNTELCVSEFEAARAEREKQEPIATVGWDRNFMGVVWHGKDMPEKGVETLLYAAPPVTAPVRLTDMQVVKLFQDFNERDGASHADLIQSTEVAVLRANGFDIQAQEGK